MKRVLINGRFLTQPVSGVQRYAREMVAALPAGSATYAIVVPRGATAPPGPEPLADDSTMTGVSWEQLRLPGWMQRWNADLLWSPCNVGPLGVEAQVVTIHDASVFAGPEWFSFAFRTYYRWILPRLGRKVRQVVTDSEFSRTELFRFGIADTCVVIPPGVGAEFAPGRGPRGRDVLFVGSLDPRKNAPRLVEAWRRLPAPLRQGRTLRMAGGPGRAFAPVELGALPPDVRLEGHVAEDRMPALYAEAELLVLPSLYEGFGLPALEAMASGTPVLVSRAASLPEVCGEAAAYCDPADVGDIAHRLERLLGNAAWREELRRRGLERASRFTWASSAAKLAEVFERV